MKRILVIIAALSLSACGAGAVNAGPFVECAAPCIQCGTCIADAIAVDGQEEPEIGVDRVE